MLVHGLELQYDHTCSEVLYDMMLISSSSCRHSATDECRLSPHLFDDKYVVLCQTLVLLSTMLTGHLIPTSSGVSSCNCARPRARAIL